MKNAVWNIPVQIGDEIIFNSFQGHKYLLRQKSGSAEYADAERAMRLSLDGRMSPEEARKKFAAVVGLH